MTILRLYQREAVDAVLAYWQRGGSNPIVELPTGAGKSVVIAELARHVVDVYSQRFVMATHRSELVEQNAQALRKLWQRARVGVFSAKLGRREIADVTMASVDSIYRRARELGGVGVLCVDECHRVDMGAEKYGRLIRELAESNPDMRVLGFTATPFRGAKMKPLTVDNVFDSVVYRVGVRELIDQGYLTPLVAGMNSANISTVGLKIVGGEFSEKETAERSDTDEVNNAACSDVAGLIKSGARKSALLFGVTVEHAMNLQRGMLARGVSCGVITGTTSHYERVRIIADFKAQRLSAIASCAVLTEGFDAPCVDVVAVARPILAPALWVQICGRGTRLFDGKTDCVILDYGTNTARLGPIDDLKQKRKGAPPSMKLCEACDAPNLNFAQVCAQCLAPFPPAAEKEGGDDDDDKRTTEASTLDVISSWSSTNKETGAKMSAWTVHSVQHSVHNKDGRASLRLDYWGCLRGKGGEQKIIASKFLSWETRGGAFAAARWWAENASGQPPSTLLAAVGRVGDIACPVEVVTEKRGKYREIVSAKFHGAPVQPALALEVG